LASSTINHPNLVTLSTLRKNRGGFTLVEIMIVVAIIALLAAIALPNFMRARKRSQATQILADLRMLDAAMDQYFIENDKSWNAPVEWNDVVKYVKNNTRLANSASSDILQNFFIMEVVGPTEIRVGISQTSFDALSDVAPLEFWSPFPIGN